MTPAELVETLERRGLHLRVDGEDLAIRPPSALTQEDVATLKARKSEVLAFLRHRPASPVLETLAATSLYKLTKTLVVEVPGLGGPLYITPSCAEAERLRTEPKPCVALCCCRVIDMLLSGVDKAGARAALEAALLFGGDVETSTVQ